MIFSALFSCCSRVGDDVMKIYFHENQKAVADGQVATVWDGDWCLGCGTIVLEDTAS